MARWNTPLGDLTFVAFDVETTGLSPVDSEIVELALVKFRLDGQESGRLQTLVRPTAEISAELTAIHGITTDMAMRGVPLSDALALLASFLGPWNNTVMVAHNAPFDVGFITAALDKYAARSLHIAIDTLGLARANLRYLRLPNHKLGTVAGALGVEAEGVAHRALADTVMCKDIFLRLMEPWSASEGATLEGVNGLFGAYRFNNPPSFAAAAELLAL